jgi:hypothetical protein
MAELSRVPAPRSPFEGRSGKLVALVLAGIALAIAKPWNPPPSATPVPRASVVPVAVAPSVPPSAAHPYDPAIFGEEPPEPAWEVWPASASADGPTPFAPPPGSVAPPAPGRTGSSGAQEGTPRIGGPVIELGSSDDLTAIGINHPADVDLVAVRLWRFRDGGEPERVQLTEQPAPWRRGEMRVFVVRDARLPRGQVLRWRPGLYRLDLLVDPADRIRSLVLNVRAGQIALPPEPGTIDHDGIDVAILRRLPAAATFWSYGTYLSGWAGREPVGHCRVAELWRGWKLGDACHPIPVGRPQALGVNLPAGTTVSDLKLREIDPLPGQVAVVERTDVANRPGLAYVGRESGVFSDGIYELAVGTAAGDLRWYVEVSAHGIAWGG